MLDQLGLADRLAQECFACRNTVSYDPEGKEVMGRGWAFMENMKDTQWDFALVLVCFSLNVREVSVVGMC